MLSFNSTTQDLEQLADCDPAAGIRRLHIELGSTRIAESLLASRFQSVHVIAEHVLVTGNRYLRSLGFLLNSLRRIDGRALVDNHKYALVVHSNK